MLEQPALVLGPWRDVAADGRQVRGIADAANSAELGRVRRLASKRWLPWRRYPGWEVLETEDESLLFTMHRPGFWHWSWTFFDAEEHLLGSFSGNRIWAGAGEWLADVAEDDLGKWLLIDPRTLATLETQATGAWRFEFNAELQLDPFTRMALLGAAVVLAEER